MKPAIIALLLVAGALAGCLGDSGPEGDVAPTPERPSSQPSFAQTIEAPVTMLEPIARLTDAAGEPVPSGAGIWPYGDYVFGSGLGAGFWIADVSDPADPVLLFNATADSITSFARDADVVEHDDGRLLLVLATQSDGMHVWDVTDPAHPVFMSRTFDETVPNHNVAVVPGTHLVFNSRSGGAGSTNDLVDLRDPLHPIVVGTYGTHGCHDITYFGHHGADRFRAYCAGIDRTEIWDMDGFDPAAEQFGIRLVSTVEGTDSPVIGNPAFSSYPLRTLHHLAMVDSDGDILILGDEHNGGASPGTCFLYDPVTGLSTPLGALWFYDISDETAPELLSWFSPPTVTPHPRIPDPTSIDPTGISPTNPLGVLGSFPNCTAHFGTLVPGEDKLAMAWYSSGVVLVDFSDPTRPTLVDQFMPEGINTWDARIHGGYVFTGDITRGMDIVRLG